MSELAFDANGEPITFPVGVEELRVRRFRNPGMRGACEVVHDRDGAPLYVPVDTSYVEFRALVDAVPGRYRLDPVDLGRQPIANTAPAYVTLTEPLRNVAALGAADDRDSVIRELVRANVEMTKTIADRFGGVMQAAAELLRAADGAGLPRREPAREMEDVDDDDGPDQDVGEDDDSPDIATLIAQVLPMIQMWLAARAAEKTAVAPPAAVAPAMPVPAPATTPAVARDATLGESDAAAGQEPWTAPGAVEGEAPKEVSAGAPSGPQHEVRAGGSTPSPSDGGGRGATRNAARTWLPGLDHLLAIYAELLPAEKRIVQLVVARMSPDVRAQWLGELSRLTVEQAVALVRSMIPQAQSPKERDS